MKILIVTQYFWPENFKINDLAYSLKESGHEVTVLTGIPNYPKGKFYEGYGLFRRKNELYKGVNVNRVFLIPRGKSGNLRLFLNYLSFALCASLKIIFNFNKEFDFIFVYEPSPITVGIPAIILKKIKKIPILFWVQDLWPESVFAVGNLRYRIVENLISGLVKYIYKNCDKILISSKGFESSIIQKNVEKEKIEYIPNWAEDSYFNCDFNKFKDYDHVIPNTGFKILFAGNLGEAQDFESVLRGIELTLENEEIKWIFLGDGRKRNWIEKEIINKGLQNKVFLQGSFPSEMMPYFFSKADVMLVSLKDEYIFSLTVPSKVQTYLACGKPILAMINGEGAKIIEESNAGFTCNAGDYKKLAKNVIKLYNLSPQEKKQMSKNAIDYYNKNFKKELIINKIENILSEFYKIN